MQIPPLPNALPHKGGGGLAWTRTRDNMEALPAVYADIPITAPRNDSPSPLVGAMGWGMGGLRFGAIFMLAALLLTACSALSQPTPTPSPTATSTLTPALSATPTSTATLTATVTPTATITPSPTETPLPTRTPPPAANLVFDNWRFIDLPDALRSGMSSPMVAFVSANNLQTIRTTATAQPFTGQQTLYFASPAGAFSRIPALELASARRLEVILAQRGNALAYIREDGGPREAGLYILNMELGLIARVLPGENPLTPRGIHTQPSFSPDGAQVALDAASGHALDIFVVQIDGSGSANITSSGSYDFWSSWSPDGERIAFVSDRAECPSWNPADGQACDATTQPVPSGGHIYIHDLASGSTERLSDVVTHEPPYWINERLLAFSSGDPFDLLNPQRRIWQADVLTGETRQTRLPNDSNISYLSEVWSPSGRRALVQLAGSENPLALLRADGALAAEDTELNFPRYGMTASWSPSGGRLAIGGSGGNCPYGARVKNSAFETIASRDPPPTMCDPQFSPDGEYIAFSGVKPRVTGNPDGRNDVYVASPNGFGAKSLTSDLKGQVRLIGWVGG